MVFRAHVLVLSGAGAPAGRCWRARNSSSSSSSSSRTSGGVLPPLHLVILLEQTDHLIPHWGAPLVGVAIRVFDNRRVGAQLVLGIENDPRGTAHALPSDSDVFVDLHYRAFDHQRIVHAADQLYAAPGGQDDSEAHDVGLNSLNRPVSD